METPPGEEGAEEEGGPEGGPEGEGGEEGAASSLSAASAKPFLSSDGVASRLTGGARASTTPFSASLDAEIDRFLANKWETMVDASGDESGVRTAAAERAWAAEAAAAAAAATAAAAAAAAKAPEPPPGFTSPAVAAAAAAAAAPSDRLSRASALKKVMRAQTQPKCPILDSTP